MNGLFDNPFLVTCEHASNRLPTRYGTLGLDPARLNEHIAWDRGARGVARRLARKLDSPLFEGRYSRLLIDLNRNLKHPKLIAQSSFGIEVPGNQGLDSTEREQRVREHWTPYRNQVLAMITRIIDEAGQCIHFGIHSFTPIVDGIERDTCIAILYDPSRRCEVDIAARMIALLESQQLRVRRNYPYRGVSDGLVTVCRRVFSERQYAGLEIEVSQKLLEPQGSARRIADLIATTAVAAMQPADITPSK